MQWTKEHLLQIRKFPHLLGHIIGKEKLQLIHSHWVRYLWESKTDKALMGHRGSYKSSSAVLTGMIWYLLFNPDSRIALIRKSFTKAAGVVKAISNAFEMEELVSLFEFAHGVRPKKITDSNGSIKFNFKKSITPEPSIQAHGLDAGMTGQHYDRIICDDFITLKDRLSRAERRKTHEIIREVQTNIIDPGKPVSYVGTPWHRDDAWKLCPMPIMYDVRKAGLLNDEQIKLLKTKTTPSLYSANYELQHIADDSKMFSSPEFVNRWDRFCKNNWMQVDAAYDGKHTCGLSILGVRSNGQKQVLLYAYPGNIKDWFYFISDKYIKYKCRGVLVEDNPDKGYTADKLQELGMNVIRYQETLNKHHKIGIHIKEHWNELEFIEPDYESTEPEAEYQKEALLQLTDWVPGQEPDDAPDSLASLLARLDKLVKHDILYSA